MKMPHRGLAAATLILLCGTASAQYRSDAAAVAITQPDSLTIYLGENPTVLTLDDALRIALSENVSVKVADMEIERTGYAKKGTYASLFPQVDASGSFTRTIKKQVMYMDFDMSSLTGDSSESASTDETASSSSGGGIEVGRWNSYSGGVSASMPLVNAQLWKSIKISGQDVELAVEKARSSRLEMVTQLKQAYYAVLLAKEAFEVYKEVYENAVANMEQVRKRYNAQRASELDYTRSKTTVANAIPNVYNAESSVILALWQLKAVMGIDLDQDIDVSGRLDDYAEHMFYDIHQHDSVSLDGNSSLRQLAIQAEQLAETIKMQKYAYLPTLAASYSYSMTAMENDFEFRNYQWTPYSYVGLSLSIPIFSGGKRLNDVRQAKVQAAELDLQRVNSERQLKISIRQYLNTMETNMKTYTSALEAQNAAQKAYDIAFKSYSLGRSTLTDLNDSQLSLTQARLSVSQAIYDFVVAKSSLEETIGCDFLDADGEVDFDAYGTNDK